MFTTFVIVRVENHQRRGQRQPKQPSCPLFLARMEHQQECLFPQVSNFTLTFIIDENKGWILSSFLLTIAKVWSQMLVLEHQKAWRIQVRKRENRTTLNQVDPRGIDSVFSALCYVYFLFSIAKNYCGPTCINADQELAQINRGQFTSSFLCPTMKQMFLWR